MLYRRARSLLMLIGVFWLWLLLGSAGFIASFFETPFYALLALYGLGVVTLISILAALGATGYMLLNRPPAPAAARPSTMDKTEKTDETGKTSSARSALAELAPVVRMVPRRMADSSAALANQAAAKWRDLAS